MQFGYADPAELDEASRQALEAAAETLRFEYAREACRLGPDEVLDADGWMATALPPKHRLRYTREFAFEFLGALHVVLHRLAARHNAESTGTSTAQELAFRALIDAAVSFLDDGADDEPLWEFHELHTEDADIEILFEGHLDGLEEPGMLQDISAVVNLEFGRWFEPFGGAWPPASPGAE